MRHYYKTELWNRQNLFPSLVKQYVFFITLDLHAQYSVKSGMVLIVYRHIFILIKVLSFHPPMCIAGRFADYG